MADDCPECMAASAALRRIADGLSASAGSVIGGALGGLTKDPMNIYRGRAVGAALAPQIIERGAMNIAKKVKRAKSSKKRDKSMSKAMKTVNARARTKAGKIKKGWDQAKIMKAAHKECRRLMK